MYKQWEDLLLPSCGESHLERDPSRLEASRRNDNEDMSGLCEATADSVSNRLTPVDILA